MKALNCSVAGAVAALLIAATGLLGQETRDSVRQGRCSEALRTLRAVGQGRGADQAMRYLSYCPRPERHRAVLAAIAGLRRSTDRNAIESVYPYVANFHDAQYFEALLEVARDRSGTDQARILALLTLGRIVHPGLRARYEDAVEGVDSLNLPRGNCYRGGAFDVGPAVVETPLPANYKAIVEDAAWQILRDPTEPAGVRGAAACT